MKKLSDDPLCFAVSLKEVIKYGLSPLSQLKKSGGSLNLKDSFNTLVNIQGNKRIQEKKREYKRKEG